MDELELKSTDGGLHSVKSSRYSTTLVFDLSFCIRSYATDSSVKFVQLVVIL